MRLLVVEDQSLLRQQLVLGLTRHGYVVDDAADGKAGLYFAGYLRFDAVLNLLFLVFTLLPLPPALRQLRWAGLARQLSQGVLGFLLLVTDRYPTTDPARSCAPSSTSSKTRGRAG